MAAGDKSLMPTRKWWASRVTAIAGLVVMIINDGWNTPEQIATVTVVAAAAVSYLVPNEDTPGGIPLKKS